MQIEHKTGAARRLPVSLAVFGLVLLVGCQSGRTPYDPLQNSRVQDGLDAIEDLVAEKVTDFNTGDGVREACGDLINAYFNAASSRKTPEFLFATCLGLTINRRGERQVVSITLDKSDTKVELKKACVRTTNMDPLLREMCDRSGM